MKSPRFETVEAGSLTRLFDVVARMRSERPWRVTKPPEKRMTKKGRVWSCQLAVEMTPEEETHRARGD